MGPATQIHTTTEAVALHGGGQLPGLSLAWECWGTLNADKSNAVLVFTGLSASAHAAASDSDPTPGWWEAIIGPGLAIDTNTYFVICINAVGSCLGSTGPASINPATDQPWRLDFPTIAMEDTANAAHRLVGDLGIGCLAAVIGPSMGGMIALAYLKAHPHSTQRLGLISTTAASGPFALALRALQREAIVTDPRFCDGQYQTEQGPDTGMRIARKLGMITYRSADEWDERFGRARQTQFEPQAFRMRFEVEAYLETQAQRFVGQFDPCAYLYLSRAMDEFDASDEDDSLAAMFARTFQGQALVLGVSSDLLFPPDQQRTLAEAIKVGGGDVRFDVLQSNKGHDAFLVDSKMFQAPIRRWLQ